MQARLLGGIGHHAYFFCIPHNGLNIFSFSQVWKPYVESSNHVTGPIPLVLFNGSEILYHVYLLHVLQGSFAIQMQTWSHFVHVLKFIFFKTILLLIILNQLIWGDLVKSCMKLRSMQPIFSTIIVSSYLVCVGCVSCIHSQ
jgi:hypothetical protein